MKPHQLIAPWKGDKRFTAIAKRAAALKKEGQDAEGILAAIRAEFGAPSALAGLRDQPAPAAIFGTVGEGVGEVAADIDAAAVAQIETGAAPADRRARAR